MTIKLNHDFYRRKEIKDFCFARFFSAVSFLCYNSDSVSDSCNAHTQKQLVSHQRHTLRALNLMLNCPNWAYILSNMLFVEQPNELTKPACGPNTNWIHNWNVSGEPSKLEMTKCVRRMHDQNMHSSRTNNTEIMTHPFPNTMRNQIMKQPIGWIRVCLSFWFKLWEAERQREFNFLVNNGL